MAVNDRDPREVYSKDYQCRDCWAEAYLAPGEDRQMRVFVAHTNGCPVMARVVRMRTEASLGYERASMA